MSDLSIPVSAAPDLQRRFGGLARLYGTQGYARLRNAHVAVVGLGGVGSWAVEALARNGVAQLTLVDLDHVAESNINRQVQATEASLGQAKAQALRERIAQIHPGCAVNCIEAFVDEQNWPSLLQALPDSARQPQVVIDACDQNRAKLALAQWALQSQVPLVMAGAAGGKRQAQLVQVAPLSEVTHDPLLASVRQRLRKQVSANASLVAWPKGALPCVFSREPVSRPLATGEESLAEDGAACEPAGTDGSLNCAGYGSACTVTATFGMVAAGVATELIVKAPSAA